jgi:hypothetical protein
MLQADGSLFSRLVCNGLRQVTAPNYRLLTQFLRVRVSRATIERHFRGVKSARASTAPQREKPVALGFFGGLASRRASNAGVHALSALRL